MSSGVNLGEGPLAVVLIADDDEMTRRIAARILEKMGCRVDAVADGMAAVEAAENTQYDLIFLDGVMPRMGGPEAAREIRQLEAGKQHVPIIGITGDVARITKEACLQAGMDDYVPKPFGPAAYRNAVNRWVSLFGVRSCR